MIGCLPPDFPEGNDDDVILAKADRVRLSPGPSRRRQSPSSRDTSPVRRPSSSCRWRSPRRRLQSSFTRLIPEIPARPRRPASSESPLPDHDGSSSASTTLFFPSRNRARTPASRPHPAANIMKTISGFWMSVSFAVTPMERPTVPKAGRSRKCIPRTAGAPGAPIRRAPPP